MPREWRAGRSMTLETTNEEIEEAIARRFEMVLHSEGITLGQPERPDPPDFVYDRDPPGTALEITRIVGKNAVTLSSALLRLEQKLTRLAEAEDLGCWMIAIREGSTVKTLKPVIVAFLRKHCEASVATFTSWDSTLDAGPLPDELVQLGLLSAMKIPGDPAVNVMPQVSEGSPSMSGFSKELADCVDKKDRVLREARPRMTHLAVVVEDSRFLADPHLSPPPRLTEAIDVLWVFVSDFLEPRRTGYRVWRVRRGDMAWELGWRTDAYGSVVLQLRRRTTDHRPTPQPR